jgi:hypothetical protein
MPRRPEPPIPAVRSRLRVGGAGPLAAASAVLLSLAATAAAAADRTAPDRTGWRSPPWTVSAVTRDGSGLYPAGPPVTVVVTVTSTRAGATLHQVTAAVAVDGRTGDIETSSGSAIPGCAARWFTLTPAAGDARPPVHLRHAGATYTTRMDLAMTDPPVDQDACERHAPAVTVAVS